MRRDEELLLAGVEKACRDSRGFMAQNGLTPFLALYLDTTFRQSAFCGSSKEEAQAVQRAVGADIPLVGIRTGLTLAPFDGQTRGSEWAGVLVLLGFRQ